MTLCTLYVVLYMSSHMTLCTLYVVLYMSSHMTQCTLYVVLYMSSYMTQCTLSLSLFSIYNYIYTGCNLLHRYISITPHSTYDAYLSYI